MMARYFIKGLSKQLGRTSCRHSACRLIAAALVALSMLLAHSVVFAQSSYPQRIDRQINDYANVLGDADKGTIRDVQSQLLRDQGVELVVVTINSVNDYDVPDQTIESFATNLFNSWGIGDRQRNDGVLLLVAVKDRKVRIEVGSGYGASYNSTMQRVIDADILPFFRSGEYSQGITSGVRAISRAIGQPAPAAPASAPAQPAANTTRFVPAQGAGGTAPPGVVVGGAIALLAAGALGARRYAAYLRNRPRVCINCNIPMVRLDKSGEDMYLQDGQKLEEQLQSVDYDVWRCSQCGNNTIESHSSWFSSWKKCPRCNYRTLRTTDQVLSHPTYSSTGQKEISSDCRNCGYHDTRMVVLPMLTDSSSSSSDSTSGTSDSSGGGSSSGGGASGSW